MFRKNYNSFNKNKTYNENILINRNKEKKKMLLDINSNINLQKNKTCKELYHQIDCLKEILQNKLSLNVFSQWFSSLINELEQKNINISEFLNNLYCLTNDETISTEFFNYIYKLYNSKKYYNNPDFSKYCKIAEYIYNYNQLGTICFITPDIGFCSRGKKIGELINELSQGLNELGVDVIIICPYYQCNDLKNSNLKNLRKIMEISIKLDIDYIFDIYYGEINNVKYYLIYNKYLFKFPHLSMTGVETIREISCFSKSSLQLLKDLNIIPEIIITNDSYTGFVPAYGKDNMLFNNIFQNTIFIHLCNDLENQGKIYLSLKEGTYENIHQLPNEIVTDPYDHRLVNPISCALRTCDQWAILSRAYHNNLLKNASIFNIHNLLNEKSNPIYIASGISKKEKFEIIMSGGEKEDAKKLIQKKYFCYKIYNKNIPLYSFIGKLNEDNGALLLLDIIEKLCKETNNNINILIIGNGDINDPYYQLCLKKLNYLKKSFPFCIYVEPNRCYNKDEMYLFLKGSDFGLIPFLYDNWINLHYKYFITRTPVIGYAVGHIKDSVKEFNFDYMTGNGFLFDHFNSTEFYLAIKRSLDLFYNEKLFEICKNNCEETVVDYNEVCLDLCREFCKLKNKIFFIKSKDVYDNNNYSKIYIDNYYNDNYYNNRGSYYSIKKNNNKCKDILYDSNHFRNDYYTEFGKNVKRASSCKQHLTNKKNKECLDYGDIYTISYRLDYPRPKRVQITGSYDDWSTLKEMKYNKRNNKWEINLSLKKGKYFYKFLIDNKCWKIDPFEHYRKEYNGMVNNVLYVV